MEEQPITPHAGPIFDAEGNLTYVGDDGRRYVVAAMPDADEQQDPEAGSLVPAYVAVTGNEQA